MLKIKIWTVGVVFLALLVACGPGAATPVPTAVPPPTEAATAVATEVATEEATTEATVAATAAVTSTATADETPAAVPATGQLRTPEEAALAAAGGQQLGGTVSVIAQWGGSEQDTFMAMVAPFEQATGVQVQYEGTRDINAVLTTRVQGGNPPDLAGLSGPGQMAEMARQGALVDLNTVLDIPTYQQQYAQTWLDLGTVEGELVGIFIKAAVKGPIWYNPRVWDAQGFEIPETWDELVTLSEQMAASGTAPWGIAMESAATTGWPGTDWLEDIVLRQSGREVYDQWWQGEIAWTSPEIKQAWETWGQIVANPEMIYGGVDNMLTTPFGDGGNCLFTDPPGCYMHHQATFITDFFVQANPGITATVDYDWFPFPAFNAGDPDAVEIAGDLFGMFNDTPQARALISYLTTPEAQAIWVQRGGAISPNQAVPTSLYPDELATKAADVLVGADVAVFDASDLMPEAMNQAFLRAILDYVQNPQNLDSILAELDTVQQDAYQQ